MGRVFLYLIYIPTSRYYFWGVNSHLIAKWSFFLYWTLVRILVVSLSNFWHIYSGVYQWYYAQYHCLFTTSFGAIGRGLASWGHRIEGRWGSLGIPQGDVPKSLTRHIQQIFSHKIKEMVSLKYLHLNIWRDIDLLCSTSKFLTNILIESGWMSAIWWPCSIQAGRAKLMFAKLCACRLFWHQASAKLQC